MNKQKFKQLSSDIRANRPIVESKDVKTVRYVLWMARSDYLFQRVEAKAKHIGSPYWYLIDTAPERITRRLGL